MQYSEILGLNPQQILFELIRRHSDFDAKGVTMDKLTFGPGVTSNANGRNTRLVVSPAPGSGLVNPATVFYNRLDFGQLGVYGEESLRWPLYVDSDDDIVNIVDVLGLVAETYGIVLGPGDIVDAEIDKTVYPYKCDITPTEGNQVWIGVLPLDLLVGDRDLNIIIRNAILDGLHYPSDDTTRVQGPIISYNWFLDTGALTDSETGALVADGKVLAVGDSFSDQLVTAMNAKRLGLVGELQDVDDAEHWLLSDTPSKFNLKGAVVVSDAEELAKLPFGLRDDASARIALRLSADSNTFIGGYVTLYEPQA